MAEIDDSPLSTVSESTRRFSFFPAVAIAALVGFVGCFGWLTYLAHFGLEATTQRTEELLSSKTVDRFELRDATFPEAVETFRQALKDSGIDERKVRIRIMDSAASTNKELAAQKASIVLTNIPPYEAGKYMAALFDLEVSIHGKEVRIQVPSNEPLFRRFQAFPGFVSGLSLKADGNYDVERFLKDVGIKFQEGSWATADPESGEIEVFLPKNEIGLVETLWPYTPTWKERIVNWKGTIQGWFSP